MHIEASWDKICCDEDADLALAELFNTTVSLFFLQFAEYNVASLAIIVELSVD